MRNYLLAVLPFGLVLSAQDDCALSGLPRIDAVHNAASSGTGLSFNTLVTIFGSGFAAPGTGRGAARMDFIDGRYPTELGCLAVEIGGRRVPILYAGTNQINAQVPTIGAAGPLAVRVVLNPGRSNEIRSPSATIQLQPVSPALFTLGGRFAAGRHTTQEPVADAGAAADARPARPGDVITLYGTGLGATEPVFQAGEVPDRLAPLRSPVSVTIGGETLGEDHVLFAGVAPGEIGGIYRLDIRIPFSSTLGELPVVVETQGARTQAGVILPVRNPRRLRVPADFSSIQEAVNAAAPGDTIQVSAGRYNEKIRIEKSGLRLVAPVSGQRAVIDGAGLMGHGIHVVGLPDKPVSGVEIMGFVVERFENGITLENAILTQVRLNTSQDHLDKASPWAGVIEADGFLLINSHFNTLYGNLAQRNGHDGIVITRGSSGNVIEGNRLTLTGYDHGVTWPGPWVRSSGAGGGCAVLFAGAGNNNNKVIGNDATDGDWGFLLNGASAGNLIANNYLRRHTRAGISAAGGAIDNSFVLNQAEGNGLANVAPSMGFDIFQDAASSNAFSGNKGRSNF